MTVKINLTKLKLILLPLGIELILKFNKKNNHKFNSPKFKKI